jgi:hypothetical protein
MDYKFPIKHWLITLVLAPVLGGLIDRFYKPVIPNFVGWLEFYPNLVFFSLIISLPTLILYYIVFFILNWKNISNAGLKIILIVITAIGTMLTFYFIGGLLAKKMAVAYIIVAAVSCLLLKLDRPTKASGASL